MPDTAPQFDALFREQLSRLLAWRRDVRRFQPTPLSRDALSRLIEIACSAPSVGLSQPWRFVTVDDLARRSLVRDEFRRCNRAALDSYPADAASEYARLKLAGLGEAPAISPSSPTGKRLRVGFSAAQRCRKPPIIPRWRQS